MRLEIPTRPTIKSNYQKPTLISHYSLDRNRQFINSEINTFTRPSPGNLDLGFPPNNTPHPHEHLDHLLQQIKIQGDIYTYRGILTQLFILPYTTTTLSIDISRVNGCLLMCNTHNTSQVIDLNCFRGYKFESLCTNKQVLDGEYCAIFKGKLDGMRLLFGAEIDCLKDGEYCELKTHSVNKEYSMTRYKSLKKPT